MPSINFKKDHPLTWLSVALSAAGLALSIADSGPAGILMLLLAQVCALAEFKKYTSRFQFSMILLSAGLLGLVLDTRAHLAGASTVPLLLSGSAIIIRQAYMRVFTYVNYLWKEPLILTVSAGVMLHTWFSTPFRWDLHLLPLGLFGTACFLSASYIQDGIMMKKRTRSGYRVIVSRPAPDFVLPDQQGNSVQLSDHIGKHPVLLIFVRGDWCPGCHMMLRTYERHHERFKERGVHVIGIGPDSVDVNKDMVERIGVGYRLLSDSEQVVSSKYGVVYENPAIESLVNYAEGIPLPASFLVDIQGIIRYVSRPDRVGEFLDPALIFNVLAQLPASMDDSVKAA